MILTHVGCLVLGKYNVLGQKSLHNCKWCGSANDWTVSMSIEKYIHILYISVNTMYKGMTLVIFCMNGLNHMCRWEASCIWWRFFEDVVLKILKCWCVYHQVYNVSSRLWTWNFTKPFQDMVNSSLKMYYKALPPYTI